MPLLVCNCMNQPSEERTNEGMCSEVDIDMDCTLIQNRDMETESLVQNVDDQKASVGVDLHPTGLSHSIGTAGDGVLRFFIVKHMTRL